ncbi:hypothetical protein BYT27DRAFT_7219960 [Phlegmacium glaucopus]|nr:hypothetical protein BYT27DRAFT_7219960 [Phlegmacium glaucopus]
MCHHINPRSVASYLSGISQQLEPYFPVIQEAQCSPLVEQTLKGCMHIKGVTTKQKQALTPSDLDSVIHSLQHSNIHNDQLFLAMLLTGFFTLLRLGELTFPHEKDLQSWQKISKCSLVHLTPKFYEFQLPSHKEDRFFKGNHIITLFSHLWMTLDGSVPTRHFFCPVSIIFSAMTSAATRCEPAGPPSIIQPMGRWSSDTFLIYIQKNPVLIQALLYSKCPS